MRLFLFVLINLVLAHAQTYILPSSTPANASQPSNNWFGVNYEIATWVQFALDANNQTNQFSANLYESIANRTAGVPQIRLGGTGADYAYYDPGLDTYVLPTISRQFNGPTENGSIIGPSYWQLCKNFPTAQYIIQLPIANSPLNVSATVAWAIASTSIIGMDQIAALELGNEPNSYGNPPFVPPRYLGQIDNQSYVDIFLNTSLAVAQALDISNGTRIFSDPDISMSSTPANAWELSPEALLSIGLDQAGQLKQFTKHYYPTGSGGQISDVGAVLLNHSYLTEQLDAFVPWIEYLNSASGGPIPFLFTEFAPSMGAVPGVGNVFGAALWSIDAQLYAMSIGVSAIHYSEQLSGYFILWLPQDSDGIPAQVFPPYYAWPFTGDFIGPSKQTKVIVLEASDTVDTSSIVAYAAFEDNIPMRVALLNLNLWGGWQNNGTAQAPGGQQTQTVQLVAGLPGLLPRPRETFNITVPGSCTGATVSYLSTDIGAFASADDMTYAGYQWTYGSMGLQTPGPRNDTVQISVTNGQVFVPVNNTQAALVFLTYPAGSQPSSTAGANSRGLRVRWFFLEIFSALLFCTLHAT